MRSGAGQSPVGTTGGTNDGAAGTTGGTNDGATSSACDSTDPTGDCYSGSQANPTPPPPSTTKAPTKAPTTKAPTKAPTTKAPTKAPTTKAPTKAPTNAPTKAPTPSPTSTPTKCYGVSKAEKKLIVDVTNAKKAFQKIQNYGADTTDAQQKVTTAETALSNFRDTACNVCDCPTYAANNPDTWMCNLKKNSPSGPGVICGSSIHTDAASGIKFGEMVTPSNKLSLNLGAVRSLTPRI